MWLNPATNRNTNVNQQLGDSHITDTSPAAAEYSSGQRLATKTMQAIKIMPPDQFDFQSSGIWTRWIRHFNCLSKVLVLDKKSETYQVGTLIYSMIRPMKF